MSDLSTDDTQYVNAVLAYNRACANKVPEAEASEVFRAYLAAKAQYESSVLASHPLVALWREWVEAEAAWKAHEFGHAYNLGGDPEGEALVKRRIAAERALLNYRSAT